MLDFISVDPHYLPIPYLQICQLANVYLLPPNQSAWCFGVICEHAQSGENVSSSDVHVPSQGRTRQDFALNEDKHPFQDLFNAMTSTFVCFFVGDSAVYNGP